jgi:hypothetical protein
MPTSRYQSPNDDRTTSGFPTIRPESADSLRTETSKNAFVVRDSYIPGILLPISGVSSAGFTNWDAQTSCFRACHGAYLVATGFTRFTRKSRNYSCSGVTGEGPRESMSRAYCVSCSLPIAVRALRT